MKISRFLLFRGIYLKENKGIGNVNRGQQVPYSTLSQHDRPVQSFVYVSLRVLIKMSLTICLWQNCKINPYFLRFQAGHL